MAKYLGIPIALITGTSEVASDRVLKDEDGNFVVNQIKVGDIVVNTSASPMTLATVTEVVGRETLNLSANITPAAGSNYAIYAPNDDLRGNVLMSIEGYIAARDNAGVLTVDFSHGFSANTQKYTHIGTLIVDSFLTKLYLRWLERLLVTNATSNRLDIPLNEFFNNSSNVPYYIKTINLS